MRFSFLFPKVFYIVCKIHKNFNCEEKITPNQYKILYLGKTAYKSISYVLYTYYSSKTRVNVYWRSKSYRRLGCISKIRPVLPIDFYHLKYSKKLSTIIFLTHFTTLSILKYKPEITKVTNTFHVLKSNGNAAFLLLRTLVALEIS